MIILKKATLFLLILLSAPVHAYTSSVEMPLSIPHFLIGLAHGATNAIIKNKIETINAEAGLQQDPGFLSSLLLYMSTFTFFTGLQKNFNNPIVGKNGGFYLNKIEASSHGIAQLLSEQWVAYKLNRKKGIHLGLGDINAHLYCGFFGGNVEFNVN